jgi:hypothetical protein
MTSALLIPEPSALSVETAPALCAAVVAWADESDDLEAVDDARRKMSAIEEYLAGTEAAGPTMAASRLLESRVGELLGPFPGRGHDDSAHGIMANRAHEFRTIHAGRPKWESILRDDNRMSRAACLRLSGRAARDSAAAMKRESRDAETRDAIASDLRREVRLGSLTDALDDLAGTVDAIITDPPYPREFLPLFGDLARLADRLLTPDGVLAVMVGQPHLPTVFRLLDGFRPYRWTIAYLTPGPDGIVHGRAKVASAWKPVIVYGGGRRFRDIVTSGGDDKSAHHWQQDFDGFVRLVDMLTEPGQLVVDPFMGSGTTLLAALSLGRHAIGCDIDPAAVASARERLGLE